MVELNDALEQITALNSTITAFETTVGMITEVVLKAGVYSTSHITKAPATACCRC